MDDARKEEARERARGRLYEKILQLQDELDQLRVELAAVQARESKWREAIAEAHDCSIDDDHRAARSILMHTLAHPADDTILREMIEAARKEEREACAKIFETYEMQDHMYETCNAADRAADAIRARKE